MTKNREIFHVFSPYLVKFPIPFFSIYYIIEDKGFLEARNRTRNRVFHKPCMSY